MDLYSYLARPSRLGPATVLGTALIVLVLCLSFEYVVPVQASRLAQYQGHQTISLRPIVLYATAGGVHILLCIGGMTFFWAQLRAAETKPELTRIISGILISIAIIMTIVLIACFMDLNLVQQSYKCRIAPLVQDTRFATLLAQSTIPYLRLQFQTLALFPLLLVLFGVAIAVVACFWIAHKAISFANRIDELQKRQIVEMKRSVAQLISLIAIVFTTSTLATIALMQIGRDQLDKGALKEAYIQNGDAMSIFWSACYTSVIAAIVLLPLCWIAGYTKRVQRQARYAGERASFYDYIYEVISLRGLSQAGAGMLVPIFTSVLATIFGS